MLQLNETYNGVKITNRFLMMLDKTNVLSRAITNAIDMFETGKDKQKMQVGNAYYHTDNIEINNRKMLIYGECDDGKYYEDEDPYKSNFKMASGYFPIVVDQKTSYSLGKPINIDTNIKDFWTEEMQEELKEAGTEASVKVKGWIHPYINNDGEYKIKSIKPEQCIPFWNTEDLDELEMMIRYYSIKVMDEQGEFYDVNRVEVWDKEQVSYFEETIDNGEYYLINNDAMYSGYTTLPYTQFGQNPRMHFKKNMQYGSVTTTVEGLSFGKVPFIQFVNNNKEQNDLKPIKNYIDVYDFIQSDFANTIVDSTAVYWTLKGYNGQGLKEFMAQVKRYKAIKVGEGGDARMNTVDVPHEAYKAEIANLEDKIYRFAQAVNTNKFEGGNITNVWIRTQFAPLDLKANDFEMNAKKVIREIFDFYNQYAANKQGEKKVEYNEITFNRSMIVNEVELAELANASMGSLSEKTRLSNDPRVDDAEEEMTQMKKEEASEPVRIPNNVDDVTTEGENEEDETE